MSEDVKVPDSLGYLTAWRGWNTLYPGFLTDMNKNSIWTPGEANEFVRLKNTTDHVHLKPQINCTCGFWGVYELEDLIGYTEHLTLYGRTAFWGTIIKAEKGIRAEKAYPLELIIVNYDLKHRSLPEIIESYQERYQVPVSANLNFVKEVKERIEARNRVQREKELEEARIREEKRKEEERIRKEKEAARLIEERKRQLADHEAWTRKYKEQRERQEAERERKRKERRKEYREKNRELFRLFKEKTGGLS